MLMTLTHPNHHPTVPPFLMRKIIAPRFIARKILAPQLLRTQYLTLPRNAVYASLDYLQYQQYDGKV